MDYNIIMTTKQDLINNWKKNYNFSPRVLAAFEKVPREEFVLPGHKIMAYEDVALPYLCGQTISQPSTVMIMTEALEVRAGHTVLEIGTGTGYQSAILSQLVGKKGKIISLEIIPELVNAAQKNLQKSKINNVKVILSNGTNGYAKYAPYDRIIVTAGAQDVLEILIDQLKVNGIMLIPVGPCNTQQMLKIVKLKNGNLDIKELGDFIFVKMRKK